MTEQLRRLFSSVGWLVRSNEEAEQEIGRARDLLASGEGTEKQRSLAARLVEAAGIEPAFEKQEVQPVSNETDGHYERLRQLARETTRNPPSAPATAEDVMAEAVAKLGKSRTDEIIAYATDHKQDVAGTLRAELDFVAAHPRVEALPIKKTARVASSRHSR